VAFKFLANVTKEKQVEVMTAFSVLKNECVNQTTGKHYIVSLDTGFPNSLEGKDQGMEQGKKEEKKEKKEKKRKEKQEKKMKQMCQSDHW
jgi:hypothetical protein